MQTFKLATMIMVLAFLLINLIVSPLIIITFELQPIFYLMFSISSIVASINYMDELQ